MKYLAGILLILAATGCQMQKWCAEHYPVPADTLLIENVRDSIVYRDTTITVYIVSETAADTVEIPCPPPPPFFVPDTAVVSTTFATARAWFSYPDIVLVLVQKDSLISLQLDSVIKQVWYWKDKYEQITAVQEVVKIPLLYRIALWMLAGMVFLGAIIMLLKRF